MFQLWGISGQGCSEGLVGVGACAGDLPGGFKEAGLCSDWILSGSGNNSMMGYLNLLIYRGWTRARLKVLLGRKQLPIFFRRGDVLVFVGWIVFMFYLCSHVWCGLDWYWCSVEVFIVNRTLRSTCVCQASTWMARLVFVLSQYYRGLNLLTWIMKAVRSGTAGWHAHMCVCLYVCCVLYVHNSRLGSYWICVDMYAKYEVLSLKAREIHILLINWRKFHSLACVTLKLANEQIRKLGPWLKLF